MALPTLTARQVLDATTGREVPVQQVSRVGAGLAIPIWGNPDLQATHRSQTGAPSGYTR